MLRQQPQAIPRSRHRYDKRDENFLVSAQLASVRILLRHDVSAALSKCHQARAGRTVLICSPSADMLLRAHTKILCHFRSHADQVIGFNIGYVQILSPELLKTAARLNSQAGCCVHPHPMRSRGR